ncbi:MAG: hypothetical protein ACW987_11975 [Candidatus Thorarchaeota archaeon]|jgi:hypothetical protein
MQETDILNLLLEFILSPIFLFAVAMIICVIAARRYSKRPKTSTGMPVVRQMRRMISEVDKDRDLAEPSVRSRQDIITTKFETQMKSVGLKPSSDSGYIPVSYTPLARFLKDRGVQDDTIGAILAGLMEEETAESVRGIIDAAADTPGVDLIGEELEKAKLLGVEEWKNLRRSKDA